MLKIRKMKFDAEISMWLWAIILVTASVSPGCDSNPVDYSAPARIEYTIEGGFAGIRQNTSIDERGLAELVHSSYNGHFISHFQLTENRLHSLRTSFDQAGFFSLKDKYLASQPVADGFRYSITYTAGENSKTVSVEDGADFPKRLEEVLAKLHDTNFAILSNSDTGTLFIGVQYTVKEWPFTGRMKLADRLYENVYFTDSELSRAIYDFFVAIFLSTSSNEHFLFWEGDFLYSIDVNTASLALPFEANIGSHFYPGNKFNIGDWPEETGIELAQIGEDGVILEGETLILIRQLLNPPSTPALRAFILNDLVDGGKAANLVLISGSKDLAE